MSEPDWKEQEQAVELAARLGDWAGVMRGTFVVPTEEVEYSVRIPGILDGLTPGQALNFLGYDFLVTGHEVGPARYNRRRKRFTRRAARWHRRHWATFQHIVTLVKREEHI